MRRRDFMLGATAVALAPFVLGSTSGSAAELYSRAYFEARVARWFRLESGAYLELVEVVDGPASTTHDQFRVVFRGDPRDAMTEGTYPLLSEDQDSLALFLQSGAPAPDGPRYVAALTRPRPVTTASC
jgi:hypothetical protein